MLTLQPLALPLDGVRLPAELDTPAEHLGIVVIARGAGSCRHDPGHRAVAEALHGARVGALLVDLLTDAEERAVTGLGGAPDEGVLTRRLLGVVDWLAAHPAAGGRQLGILGSGAAARPAVEVAGRRPGLVAGVAVRAAGPSPAGSGSSTPLLALGDEGGSPAAAGDAAARWFPTVLGRR